MKLSDYLIEELFNITGTTKIFGYIGGMIAHLVDSIYKNTNVEMVNTIHEQGAGFAADAWARISNKTGIAVATSGPGATNLLTPIADCFFDSVPVLFITGQVNTYEYKKYNIRQCGFQETDIVSMVKPVTKYAKTVSNPDDIAYEIQKAVYIANSGRKGPVLLDIPMDIQRAEINPNNLKNFDTPKKNIDKIDFDYSIIERAKKPLILVGNGINLSNAKDTLRKVILKYNIPVAYSLHAADCIEGKYEYNMGFIGTYGNRYGNLALFDCDLLIVIGARLDIRQLGANIDFLKNKTVVHVDIDQSEITCPKLQKIGLCADAKVFLEDFYKQNLSVNIKNWQNICKNLKENFSNNSKAYKLPTKILSEILEVIPPNSIVTADVGQNQMWTAQSFCTKSNQRLLSSGGLGAMGFALPAAIGACFSSPLNICLCICGDGGLQMNIQELEVIKRRNLPVKIIVMNNNNLGMVRTFQELYFDNRTASTVWDYSAPDFTKVAQAYGISAKTINSTDFDINTIKQDLLSKYPVLININLEVNTQVEPRVQFGNSIANAHPIIEQSKIEKILNEQI